MRNCALPFGQGTKYVLKLAFAVPVGTAGMERDLGIFAKAPPGRRRMTAMNGDMGVSDCGFDPQAVSCGRYGA